MKQIHSTYKLIVPEISIELKLFISSRNVKDISKWPFIFHNTLEEAWNHVTVSKKIPSKIGFNCIRLNISFLIVYYKKKEKSDLPILWLFSSNINYFQDVGHESKIIWLKSNV